MGNGTGAPTPPRPGQKAKSWLSGRRHDRQRAWPAGVTPWSASRGPQTSSASHARRVALQHLRGLGGIATLHRRSPTSHHIREDIYIYYISTPEATMRPSSSSTARGRRARAGRAAPAPRPRGARQAAAAGRARPPAPRDAAPGAMSDAKGGAPRASARSGLAVIHGLLGAPPPGITIAMRYIDAYFP